MKALLVRIGIDAESGNWNAPVDENRRFVYVPIPQSAPFRRGCERRYGEILPALERFCEEHYCHLYNDLAFPEAMRGRNREMGLRNLDKGDLIVFYGALRPVHRLKELTYALMGMYVVKEVLSVADAPEERWRESVHLRTLEPEGTDIVVWAEPEVSGRFDRCVPVGEWRQNAYRVRNAILDAWGGLSVKDGWIQRNGVPPSFNNPRMFLDWLKEQKVQMVARNN